MRSWMVNGLKYTSTAIEVKSKRKWNDAAINDVGINLVLKIYLRVVLKLLKVRRREKCKTMLFEAGSRESVHHLNQSSVRKHYIE